MREAGLDRRAYRPAGRRADERQRMSNCAIDRFERAFAEWLGVPYAFAFWRGRVALYAILRALGIGPGDVRGQRSRPACGCTKHPHGGRFRRDLDPTSGRCPLPEASGLEKACRMMETIEDDRLWACSVRGPRLYGKFRGIRRHAEPDADRQQCSPARSALQNASQQ